MKLFQTIIALSGCLGIIGCHAPRCASYSSTQPLHVLDTSPEADATWTAIQDTLRRNYMPLDRVDRRAGVITTLPVMSQHWFEFWRGDVATKEDALEATINPIRRWVEVTVAMNDSRNWTQLSVAVHKQRLSSPDRQFNSSGASYQFFGESLPSTTGDPNVTAQDDRWIDVGRDAALEESLLNKMLNGTNPQIAATGDTDADG